MIKISRKSSIADRFRAYEIRIDGNSIGKIKNGQTLKFDITPGKHIVMISIDWGCSNSVDILVDHEMILLECGSNFSGFKIFKAAKFLLFPSGDYLWLRKAK